MNARLYARYTFVVIAAISIAVLYATLRGSPSAAPYVAIHELGGFAAEFRGTPERSAPETRDHIAVASEHDGVLYVAVQLKTTPGTSEATGTLLHALEEAYGGPAQWTGPAVDQTRDFEIQGAKVHVSGRVVRQPRRATLAFAAGDSTTALTRYSFRNSVRLVESATMLKASPTGTARSQPATPNMPPQAADPSRANALSPFMGTSGEGTCVSAALALCTLSNNNALEKDLAACAALTAAGCIQGPARVACVLGAITKWEVGKEQCDPCGTGADCTNNVCCPEGKVGCGSGCRDGLCDTCTGGAAVPKCDASKCERCDPLGGACINSCVTLTAYDVCCAGQCVSPCDSAKCEALGPDCKCHSNCKAPRVCLSGSCQCPPCAPGETQDPDTCRCKCGGPECDCRSLLGDPATPKPKCGPDETCLRCQSSATCFSGGCGVCCPSGSWALTTCDQVGNPNLCR